MEKIKGIDKIISVGPTDLDEYDLTGSFDKPFVGKIQTDLFVYWYQHEGYEGDGFAAWLYKGKWAYTYLGHCSCNGPTENLVDADTAKFTLTEIRKILKQKDNEKYSSISKYLTIPKKKRV